MLKKKKYIIVICIVLFTTIFTTIFLIGNKHLNDKKLDDIETYGYTINDNLKNGRGKKARVIILAGQSNASGFALDEYLKANISSEKYEEYSNGYKNFYINYQCDYFFKSNGFINCQNKLGGSEKHFGPELGIAERLSELYPNEKIFIIKYSIGGTGLFCDWLSPSSGGPAWLYQEMINFTKASLNYLVAKNYDISIEAFCWMQGEADSLELETSLNYEQNLTNFIYDIRNEFSKYAASDGIAFIDAHISNSCIFWKYCDNINNAKTNVAKLSNMNTAIDTNSFGLTTHLEPVENPDIAHYDSLSELKLGHLFAEEIIKYFN